ncbi:unnamed protein product [Caenorhabditis nigoni]
MPISLLKLPCLVRDLVVTQLEYQDLFLLSICSRRTKFLVKEARIKNSKLTFLFEQSHGYNTFSIGVFTGRCMWIPVTSLLHVPKLALKEVCKVKLDHDYEAATNIDIWCPLNGVFLNRVECANEPMAIHKAFQDHINSIFHYSDTYQLFLSTKPGGNLPNISNVTEIRILEDTVDPTFLTNVLTRYPDVRSLSIASISDGELPKDSPFFQIQNVGVRLHSVSHYFLNFLGRNIRLQRVTLTNQDLLQFLDKWISNEAYHNLETLTIYVDAPNTLINEELIRQTIEFEEYDPNEPEKRPEHFVFDVPYVSVIPRKFSLRDPEFVEIKRITDGKRAFFRFDITSFQLLVHND